MVFLYISHDFTELAGLTASMNGTKDEAVAVGCPLRLGRRFIKQRGAGRFWQFVPVINGLFHDIY